MKSADHPMPSPKFHPDADGYVEFGHVSRALLHQQAQYASGFVDDLDPDAPNLCGNDIRIRGSSADYSSLRIHIDDIGEFINRYNAYKQSQLEELGLV